MSYFSTGGCSVGNVGDQLLEKGTLPSPEQGCDQSQGTRLGSERPDVGMQTLPSRRIYLSCLPASSVSRSARPAPHMAVSQPFL